MYHHRNEKGTLGQAWDATSRHWRLFLLAVIIFIALWARAAATGASQTASLDDPVVQRDLGYIYDKGIGVPQDEDKAVEWYRKAADQGLAFAQFNLGKMYETGRGVPQDYVQAYKWYSLAGDAKPRDRLAAKMSLLEIAEAKLLVKQWKPARTRDPVRQ